MTGIMVLLCIAGIGEETFFILFYFFFRIGVDFSNGLFTSLAKPPSLRRSRELAVLYLFISNTTNHHAIRELITLPSTNPSSTISCATPTTS